MIIDSYNHYFIDNWFLLFYSSASLFFNFVSRIILLKTFCHWIIFLLSSLVIFLLIFSSTSTMTRVERFAIAEIHAELVSVSYLLIDIRHRRTFSRSDRTKSVSAPSAVQHRRHRQSAINCPLQNWIIPLPSIDIDARSFLTPRRNLRTDSIA